MTNDSTERLGDNDLLGRIVTLVQSIDTRQQALERKVDERLHDTRPLWESVKLQLAELHKGQSELAAQVQEIRAELDKFRVEMNRELRHIDTSIGTLAGHFIRLDTYERDLESRVRDLESKRP